MNEIFVGNIMFAVFLRSGKSQKVRGETNIAYHHSLDPNLTKHQIPQYAQD
jgi:hypothetical protein